MNPPEIKNSLGVIWQLEPRFMFDGAAATVAAEATDSAMAETSMAVATDNDSKDAVTNTGGNNLKESFKENRLSEQLANYVAPNGPVNEIVFVDTSIDDYETILTGIDPNIQVVLLDSRQDGIEQIADYLSQSHSQSIDAIHIISHGNQAELFLGTGKLTVESMQGEYADELAIINQALSKEADFLIYGCNFGEGETGQEAAEILARLTGADVAASNDLTGNTALGGNWDLEISTGFIETSVVIGETAQNAW
ncbi:MAG: DUF4347 domain-containing protein, partial [Nitrosomonas sp.]|nr:DUF4347 domain-containing protein [Nitrosomonas sp.]